MAGIAVHVLAARPSLSWLWGAHFYAFFPPVLLYGATLLLATSMLIIVLREERTAARMTSFLARTLSGRRLLVMASVAVVAGTALFWVARICHSYLGDGNTIVQEIDTKHELLEREPLTSLLQYLVYGIAKPWFFAPDRSIEDVAFDAVAVGSVGAGLMFLVAAWLLADELVRLRPVQSADEERRPFTALVWLILVAQGYVQLFFGYVENYSFYAVGVVVYLWLCLRCLRGACPLLFPALALFLCFALHLSSIVLGASFLAIAVPALSRRDRRRAAIR